MAEQEKDTTDDAAGEDRQQRPSIDDGVTSTKKGESASISTASEPRNFAQGTDDSRLALKDLERFRLNQDFTRTGAVKVLTQVPVRKAGKTTFFRAHDEHWFDTMILELKEDSESYLVEPELQEELQAEIVAVTLVLCVTRQGVVFIWPVRLPDAMGRVNPWHMSAREAAVISTTKWIRICANQQLGGYDVHEAINQAAVPAWPKESFKQLIDIAFRGKVIDRIDHPVIRRLRGEI